MRNGAPGEIRTPDLLVRSQTLYPAELRAHFLKIANGVLEANTLSNKDVTLSTGRPLLG